MYHDDDPILKIARDATRVKQNIYRNDRTIGPATAGNLPLPQAEAPQGREGWLMSHISDVLPVVGESRALAAGHAAARQGHPLLGAGMAMAAMLPMGGSIAKALGKEAPFFSRVVRALESAPFEKGTAEQWAAHLAKNSAKGEREWTGVAPFLQQNAGKVLSRDQVRASHTPIELGEKVLRDPSVNRRSKYAIPQVLRAVDQSGATPDDMLLTLANDGDAYRALMSKHPHLRDDEDWAQTVLDDVYGTTTKPTKFAAYTEPGGTNYREKLITLPGSTDPRITRMRELKQLPHTVENLEEYQRLSAETRGMMQSNNPAEFRSSHFDEPNILAHLRLKDRELPNGEKVLHVEEIQSDWHQKGRSSGYDTPELRQQRAEADKVRAAAEREYTTAQEAYGAYRARPFAQQSQQEEAAMLATLRERGDNLRAAAVAAQPNGTVPNAPFKKTEEWQLLGLKHAIHDAVHGGYDRVAWTPGELQNARYDLSKSVDRVEYHPSNGTFGAYQGGGIVHTGTYDPKALPDVVGKDVAERLLDSAPHPDTGMLALEGDDLAVQGQGMTGFYDKMLPNNLRDYLKKLGVPGVEIDPADALAHSVVTPGNRSPRVVPMPFPSFRITPELRQAVMKGQPLWATLPFIGAGVLAGAASAPGTGAGPDTR